MRAKRRLPAEESDIEDLTSAPGTVRATSVGKFTYLDPSLMVARDNVQNSLVSY